MGVRHKYHDNDLNLIYRDSKKSIACNLYKECVKNVPVLLYLIFPNKIIKEWWSNAHAERSVNAQTSLSPSSEFTEKSASYWSSTEMEKMIIDKPSNAEA